MSSAANVGFMGFAPEPGAGATRGAGPSPATKGENGATTIQEGEFESELNAMQSLLPVAQDGARGTRSDLDKPLEIALSEGEAATTTEPAQNCDPMSLVRVACQPLSNLALQAIVGQVNGETSSETPSAPNLLAQQSIRARLATVVAASTPVEIPKGMAGGEGKVEWQSAVQSVPVEPEAVSFNDRRQAGGDVNGARLWDGAKLEIAAVSTETHRREMSVRDRATAISARDEAQAMPSARPLMPVRGDAFESGRSSGQSGSEMPGKGGSNSLIDAMALSQADQEGSEANGSGSSVRAFDMPSLSKVIGQAAEQLRSEAAGQVYRTPSILQPNAPAFVKSLSLDIQGDQGQTVRLRLSMHDDGIEVSLASPDSSLMSMLNSERDQLMSMLNAVGHNVVAVRLDASERWAATSLAQNTDLDSGSGWSAGNQAQGDGAFGNSPDRRKDQDRLNAPREGDRSGLYV